MLLPEGGYKMPAGKLITKPETIIKLANEGKAIWIEYDNAEGGFRQPAAFVQNYQTRMLMNLISSKKIYTYIPKGGVSK